jgi:hypothetical protein
MAKVVSGIYFNGPFASSALTFGSGYDLQDNPWSDSENGQLEGRIQRHPQAKPVHIYNIIAADTQDVFLNNLSLGKANIMDAFTGCTPSMRRLFQNYISLASA